MRIILKKTADYILWIDKDDFMNEKHRHLMNKTSLELLKEDLAANNDRMGYAKYKNILKEHGILTENEVDNWNP